MANTENNLEVKDSNLIDPMVDYFTCQSCKHNLPIEFNVRTEGFCYLCDPNITLEECLSDEPLERVPKFII